MASADEARTRELVQRAERALGARDGRSALELLRQADALAPGDIDVKMQLALALRATGDLEGALGVLDQALALDPYHLLALLSKGWLLEKLGHGFAAAEVYRNALKIAPPEDQLPAALKPTVERARAAVKEETDRLEAHLLERTRALRAGHEGERLDRFDLALQAFVGKARVYAPDPALLHFPKLPAEEYYPRELFPWLPELEAATDVIRDELLVVMREELEEMEPYIQYPAGVPVNQWVELNHSPRWNSYFLWRDGEKHQAHCERCPRTAAVLESLPMLDQPGFGPTAIFSVLAPHTTIPPHTGSANTRLVVHLPLILPGDCRFRVGNDVREWKMGEAWVFDDTIEHEAWNDSDKTRVVLIFDTWNPYLSAAERELVAAMMSAKTDYARGRS
jgi:aspartyl/asparaginyl beta-hydroxylase (cupin superfamily)